MKPPIGDVTNEWYWVGMGSSWFLLLVEKHPKVPGQTTQVVSYQRTAKNSKADVHVWNRNNQWKKKTHPKVNFFSNSFCECVVGITYATHLGSCTTTFCVCTTIDGVIYCLRLSCSCLFVFPSTFESLHVQHVVQSSLACCPPARERPHILILKTRINMNLG